MKKSITIIGPSSRFLSGISYYTTYLSNALSGIYPVNAVLFRKMLPIFLFPGASRVGTKLSTASYNKSVKVQECIDWYNPVSWYHAYTTALQSRVCIFEWWTSSVAHMYLIIGFLLKCRKIPIILEFHEVVDTLEEAILPLRIYSKIMGRMIRNLASQYIVHSEQDRHLVAERYNIPLNQITVIPLGLYDQYPKLEQKTAREHLGITTSHVILFFGLLRPYKGVTYLIHAFEQLPESLKNDTTLIIAGEPWEDHEAISLATTSEDHENIHLFSKYIGDNEVPNYFSSADVLVLPYTRASQSAVAHIGISYGMPIIASMVGGLVESLGKYDGTFFVSPQNTAELSEMLLKVLTAESTLYSIPASLRWSGIANIWRQSIEKEESTSSSSKM
ncbi:MAG: glycosyltransferase [Methanocorpusculum sp.]|jgi:glycosyltransferase involved in cell wall biosynthesis|nr:glycosyltransferase [Methanocorpusculum sp.]